MAFVKYKITNIENILKSQPGRRLILHKSGDNIVARLDKLVFNDCRFIGDAPTARESLKHCNENVKDKLGYAELYVNSNCKYPRFESSLEDRTNLDNIILENKLEIWYRGDVFCYTYNGLLGNTISNSLAKLLNTLEV